MKKVLSGAKDFIEEQGISASKTKKDKSFLLSLLQIPVKINPSRVSSEFYLPGDSPYWVVSLAQRHHIILR